MASIVIHTEAGATPAGVFPVISHDVPDMLKAYKAEIEKLSSALHDLHGIDPTFVSLTYTSAVTSDNANAAVALGVAMLKENTKLCGLLINDWDDLSESDRDAAIKKHGPVFGCAMHLVGIFATTSRKALLEHESITIADLGPAEQLAIKKLLAVAAGSDCLGGKLMKVMDTVLSPNPTKERGVGLKFRSWLIAEGRSLFCYYPLRGERYYVKFKNAFVSFSARQNIIDFLDWEKQHRVLNRSEDALYHALQSPYIVAQWFTMAVIGAELLWPLNLRIKSSSGVASLAKDYAYLDSKLAAFIDTPDVLLTSKGTALFPEEVARHNDSHDGRKKYRGDPADRFAMLEADSLRHCSADAMLKQSLVSIQANSPTSLPSIGQAQHLT
jgi:hypothetical protein